MNNSNALFVCWRDASKNSWVPVAVLVRTDGVFSFGYTRGARDTKGFRPFGRMTDITEVYKSKTLFPLFENRLLNSNRPELEQFRMWLNLDTFESKYLDPFLVFERTSGIRSTDSLELIPLPQRTEDGKFRMEFFCRGVRFLTPCSREVIERLKPIERLLALSDFQNNSDPNAIALRTEGMATFVGYLPRYLAGEIHKITSKKIYESIDIRVVRVNLDAPSEFRVLCKIEFNWPSGFSPFSGGQFTPLNDKLRKRITEIRQPVAKSSKAIRPKPVKRRKKVNRKAQGSKI